MNRRVTENAGEAAGEGIAPNGTPAAAPWRFWVHVATAALVPIVTFLLFINNGTFERSGDTRGLAYLGDAMAAGNGPQMGNIGLYKGEKLGYEAFRTKDGFVGSFFPPGVSLLAVPGFALTEKLIRGPVAGNVLFEAKYVASMMMALLCLAVWACVFARFGARAAAGAVVFLASGSVVWPHFSQGLWNQGGALFCQGVALCAVAWWMRFAEADSDRARRLAVVLGVLSGFFATYAPFCRPTFSVWWLPFAVFVIVYFRKSSWPYLIGAAPAFAAGFWVNIQATGSWFGHYAESHGSLTLGFSWARLREALPALLFSPSRGMFLYCPWVVLAIAGAIPAFLDRSPWRWLQVINLFFCITVLLIVSSFEHYWGGSSHGPRLQSDLLLCALLLAAPVLAWLLRRWWGILLVVLLWLPSAFVFHRAPEMLHYRWESAERGHRHRLWYWENGLYKWYLTGGANERQIKKRHEPPREGVLRLRPGTGANEPHFINGIEEKGGVFRITSRHARLALRAGDGESGVENYLVIRFAENAALRGQVRHIEALINGESLGRARHESGAGKPPMLVYLVPRGLLGGEPYDVISIKERRPPQSERGDELLLILDISFIPRGNANERNAVLEGLMVKQ